MKMLVIIFNYLLEQEVHALFARMDVHAYSEIPKILGTGKTGKLEDSRHGPGYNRLIFVALEKEVIEPLVEGLREVLKLHNQKKEWPAAIHAFELPCDQLL